MNSSLIAIAKFINTHPKIKALAALIETEIKLDGKMLGMDSMIISSSCKKLSRIELVYTVNLKLIKELNKIDPKLVSEDLKCYLEEGLPIKGLV